MLVLWREIKEEHRSHAHMLPCIDGTGAGVNLKLWMGLVLEANKIWPGIGRWTTFLRQERMRAVVSSSQQVHACGSNSDTGIGPWLKAVPPKISGWAKNQDQISLLPYAPSDFSCPRNNYGCLYSSHQRDQSLEQDGSSWIKTS